MKKSPVDTELLNLMVRLCHLIAFETEARTGKNLSLPHGMDQEKLNLDVQIRKPSLTSSMR